jgi:formylglycine-generating enzyme required for sulfatase activity
MMAQNRFARAFRTARLGQHTEAASLWESATAASNTEAAEDAFQQEWQLAKQQLAQTSGNDTEAAVSELRGLDQLAQAATVAGGSLRIRLVRNEILQTAAELLLANGNYSEALTALETAALLVPGGPLTARLAARTIEGMINANAAGAVEFPSELIIPVIDRAGGMGISPEDQKRLQDLLRTKQRFQLDAFLKAPHDIPLSRALQALKSIEIAGELPADSADFTAFEQAVKSRITADLSDGRLLEAAADLQNLKQSPLNGRFPELHQQVADSLSSNARAAFAQGRLDTAAVFCGQLQQLSGGIPADVLNSIRMLTRAQVNALPEELKQQVLVRTSVCGQKFLLIEPGQFTQKAESGSRQVTLNSWYYLAETELTRAQYSSLMGHLPASETTAAAEQTPVASTQPTSDARPVLLTWDEALEFCRVLSEQPQETQAGHRYRLATEAEWEFACLTGSTGPWCFGSRQERLVEYAWFAANSRGRLQNVAQLQPSVWGIFDLHGNAEEWVSDWFAPIPPSSASNPSGPNRGTLRTVKGGHFDSSPAFLSAASRRGQPPQTARCALRLVLELVPR